MLAEAALLVTALLGLTAFAEASRRAVSRIVGALDRTSELLAINRNRPDTTEQVASLNQAIASNYQQIVELQASQATLTLAVDEGIRHVTRAEKRVSRTIQVTNKKLEEHGLESPLLEAEADELRDLDGEGGALGPMPPMPSEVAPDDDAPPEQFNSGIPGY